jgi:hypothetical protein
VAVGKQYAAHFVAVFNQVSERGNYNVHTEQIIFGEHHSGIDDDDVIIPADGHTVHTELAKAA